MAQEVRTWEFRRKVCFDEFFDNWHLTLLTKFFRENSKNKQILKFTQKTKVQNRKTQKLKTENYELFGKNQKLNKSTENFLKTLKQILQ